MNYTETQQKILNAAESLIQTQGFNGFSYKDISGLIGIKTSSIHYHFPAKEDLGMAVIDWQFSKLLPILTQIKSNKLLSTRRKLYNFLEVVFGVTYQDQFKMCLGGMLASDVFLLTEPLRNKIKWFFEQLMGWLDSVISASDIKDSAKGLSNALSKHLVIHLEGGLLLGRLFQDQDYLNLIQHFVDSQIK
ncbi:MAG: TetR/AcrR family transcriptional regulator [Gammaproteobacteria bacterium]